MKHVSSLREEARQVLGLAEALASAVSQATEQAQAVARYKKMYDRASALAKIGVWECDLATNTLTWTDGVYDIFELPRGSAIDRATTAAMYDDVTGREMERLRAHAIATCGGFSMDARIRTARGNFRWMRLTADIECEDGVAVRIFGAKQDITAEKALWLRMQAMAERDPLTGLANRGMFDASFAPVQGVGAPADFSALVLIDLDGFKQINDNYGHAAGDECLRVSAERMQRAWPGARLVARIGGDEFAVLADPGDDHAAVEGGAQALLEAIAEPIACEGRLLRLGASIGVAMVGTGVGRAGGTGGGDAQAELFAEADAALYEAKAAGRGVFRVREAVER